MSVLRKHMKSEDAVEVPVVGVLNADKLTVGPSHESQFLHDVGLTLDDRGEDYGGVEDNFADIAAMWSPLLGVTVRPDQVALAMIALKLVRANKAYKRDNAIDIAGYAAHLDSVQQAVREGEG